MKLSLCIATYNEEKFIHYALDSAYEFVDEVIIVDGGSTDKTVEIVKAYGDKVKVFSVDNPPMFHINKQKALEKAKGDWILQLDADEAISPELKSEIIQILDTRFLILDHQASSIKQQASKPDAYWIPRKNYFLGRFLMKGGVYPDYTIRLYKNGAAHFPCKSVHENVEVKGEIGHLKEPLLHYADPEFGRYLKRWDRYNALDAKSIIENRTSISFFDYVIIKPFVTFFQMYVRHKGFMDGVQGFIFYFFSSIRFWSIYWKVQALR